MQIDKAFKKRNLGPFKKNVEEASKYKKDVYQKDYDDYKNKSDG